MTTLAEQSPVELAHGCKELNALDRCLANCIKDGVAPLKCDLIHQFTPGLYSRTIYLRKGSLLTTKIHKFTHQFIVSQGLFEIWTEENQWVTIVAPHIGITYAGTRRALRIHEDTIFTTFHPTNAATIEEAEKELAECPNGLELTP